jgi:hypothetical protein
MPHGLGSRLLALTHSDLVVIGSGTNKGASPDGKAACSKLVWLGATGHTVPRYLCNLKTTPTNIIQNTMPKRVYHRQCNNFLDHINISGRA